MDKVYKEHSTMVFKYLVGLTRDPDIAEEITQETFYQAVRSIDRFDNTSKMSTWLCGIAKNIWMSYLRKHPTTVELNKVPEEYLLDNNLEDNIISKEEYLEVLRIIHALNEPYKEVSYLRLFGNLSFREIGEIMNKNENWARVTFYRAKIKIQKEVKPYEK